MTADSDTIVAIATPPGTGGIGIVRISGNDAARIGKALTGLDPAPRQVRNASFRTADGELIDRGLVLWFPGPASFTGEDVLELHGHGGPVVMALLVDAVLAAGARRAEPGEFSRRAFLNDKLDLAQAEAIADLIGSSTAQAARAALRSLAGDFSKAVYRLAADLTTLRVHVEAAIDFPDEEIDFLADAALAQRMAACRAGFDTLIAEASAGRLLRDGFRAVLVGRPNAGKSSLMNALAGSDTAIVTEIAGTTRDILRETIDLDGLAVELVDTAGLRDDPGVVEKEGIRRARAAMATADAVLWVRDASAPDADGETDPALPADVPVLVVANKTDIAPPPPGDLIAVSAKTGDGLDALRTALKALAGYRDLGEGAFTARRRHIEALLLARSHFRAGEDALRQQAAGELLAEELKLSQRALGTITGEVSSDELLGHIFSSFCIGK